MFSRFKIGARLIGSFTVMACMSVVIGIIGIVSMSQMYKSDVKLYEKATIPLGDFVTIASSFHQVRITLRDMVRTNDDATIRAKIAAMDALIATITASAAKVEKTMVTEEGKKDFAEFIETRKQFREHINQIVALAKEHKTAEAYAIIDGPALLTARAEQNAIDKLIATKIAVANGIATQNGELSSKSAKFVIGCIVVGVLAIILLSIILIRSITVPLKNIANAAQRIADGNLDEKIDYRSVDEIGQLADSFRMLLSNLQGVIQETQSIVVSAGNGVLDKKANAEAFKGVYSLLLSDINKLTDSISNPLRDVLGSLGCLSNNDTTAKITKDYPGIWAEIKTSVNTCIKRIEHVVNIVTDVSRGNLSELQDLRKIGRRSEHDELVPGFIRMMDAIKSIADDINALSGAAIEGNLKLRAEVSKHSGDYQKIITGLNQTLDSITVPIQEAMRVLEKVADRDLTARVVGDYKGDHAKLKVAVNTTIDNLDTALTQVAQATEQVSSASLQISSGSQSLAQGANEQASSLEEVSSSLEEMASMTKQNADNATQAKGLAEEADSTAGLGSAAMGRMNQSINKIKESSDQTAKIVKTIDEIAMQTNLLALNAAVEAARAGEAGRGFAVVAEEVRNLAQRSAQAAKNTADMIAESVKNAEDGVKISQEVSKSFEAITASVKKVNDLIGEIAAASQEQSQGIDQVNTAVAQMDQVTQQNAANSEESASAAEELSSQAEELQQMVAQFILSQAIAKSHVVEHSPAQIKLTDTKRAAMHVEHNYSGHNGNGKKRLTGKTAGIKCNKTGPAQIVSADEVIRMDDETLKEF